MRACSYCGQDVSDKVKVCPKCKRPITAPDESAFPELRRGKKPNADAAQEAAEAERRAQAALAPDDPEAELLRIEGASRQSATSHASFAATAYTGILFFLPLQVCKDKKYAAFHANQGLVLFILMLVGAVLNFTIGGSAVGSTICAGFYGGLIYLMVLGAVRAFMHKTIPLPVIGGIHLIKYKGDKK